MKVSFVIPAYNEEKMIARCLAALQTEMARFEVERPEVEVEVVVVNNTSTDRTREIVQEMGVRVVDEPHKGMVRARAAGFAATGGELVANIDADTQVPEGWLTKVVSEFEGDPKLVALSGPYLYYDLSVLQRIFVKIFYWGGYFVSQFNQYFLKSGAVLQGGNFVIKRDAWVAAGGFDTSIEFYGEDTDVARRISKQGKVKWSWNLPMYTTARRLKQEGLFKTGFTYAINFFSITFKGRPITHDYTDIRSK